MAPYRLSQLQKLVAEALQTWRAERDKHDAPPDFFPGRPLWPYEKSAKVEAQAFRELPTIVSSRRQLDGRLKRSDPYRSTAKIGHSFYFHVKKLRLLTFLRSSAFLSDVRMAWFFQRSYELEKDLFDRKQSEYGYPLAFHRDILTRAIETLGTYCQYRADASGAEGTVRGVPEGASPATDCSGCCLLSTAPTRV